MDFNRQITYKIGENYKLGFITAQIELQVLCAQLYIENNMITNKIIEQKKQDRKMKEQPLKNLSDSTYFFVIMSTTDFK